MSVSTEQDLRDERKTRALEEIAAALRDIVAISKGQELAPATVTPNIAGVDDLDSVIKAIDTALKRRNRPGLL